MASTNECVGTVGVHFGDLPLPMVDRTKRHELMDIVAIALCAVICGADNWVDIEVFGNSKRQWFARFLNLPNGVPYHDTFGRVFSLLNTKEFSR